MKKISYFLYLLSSICLLTACSKDGKDEMPVIDNGSQLMVTVIGINEAQISSKITSKAKSSTIETSAKPLKTIQHADFDVQVSIDNELPLHRDLKGAIGPNRVAANGLRAATNSNSTTYRLYLFNKDDSTFVSSSALEFGTAGQLQVKRGKSYIWCALSYNNTEAIPDISGGNSTINLPENKDVLYTSGEFTVPNTENAQVELPITFNHKFARIAIEINTMGMFANMTAMTAAVKFGNNTSQTITNGAIDIKTGRLIQADLNQTLSTLQAREFSDIESDYQDRKTAYFYIPVLDVNQNLSAAVQINGLSIMLDDGTMRSFDTNLQATPFNFEQDISVIEPGKSYHFLFNMMESALTVNGIQWARQNLYLHNDAHNPYRFLHSYQSTAISAGWSAEVLMNQGDPCLKVYPEGSWRMPTVQETRTSIAPSGNGSFAVLTDNQSGVKYYDFNATGTASPYPGNKLRFNIIPYEPLGLTRSRYWTSPLPVMNSGNLEVNIMEFFVPIFSGDTSVFITLFTQGGGVAGHVRNNPLGLQMRCIREQ